MKTEKEIGTFCPANRQAWREWLKKHHRSQQNVWLVYYKKPAAGVPTITYAEGVDEALCFGWIDSTRRPVDEEKFMQLFCKRKPGSVWSKINKGKVQRLIEEGRMAKAGYECIETAKQNGSWSILDEVEELVVPKDLEKAFKAHRGAKKYFLGLSKSARKQLLQWLVTAKRPETRQRRIEELASLAAQQQKPAQFR